MVATERGGPRRAASDSSARAGVAIGLASAVWDVGVGVVLVRAGELKRRSEGKRVRKPKVPGLNWKDTTVMYRWLRNAMCIGGAKVERIEHT